ncbi:MAG: GTPase [Leptolyngbyaceae bacterium]|nr:GTPase [Leptolyngbyaceae bacterium]
MTTFWQKTVQYVRRFRGVNLLADWFSQWLEVDEAEIKRILATLRTQLPTTEAILIGKPQSGKSSIVRGLTGVSAEIVGQGFRPHTQHTQRYAYPSSDLPLLIFTDTVGLGEANQDGAAILAELVAGLGAEATKSNGASNGEQGKLEGRKNQAANAQIDQQVRVLIVTVKINDFAISFLKQIVASLRQRYPAIPCLLVVTCLHEIYPPDIEDHPPYPPGLDQVNRAFTALQETMAGVCDRAIMIDFTLEEDGYTPVFYGLETLRDVLADLLPEAEAQTIHQLLDMDDGASQQLGLVYRDVGRRYMLAFATIAATLAAVPLPFATMPVLTTLQVSMVGLLGKLYGQTLSPSQAGGIVSAIAGGFLAQAVGRELIKFIPGLGSVLAASWAAAYTWALGEGACVYFGELMGGKKPDPAKIQAVMKTAFEEAKIRFTQSSRE